MKNNLPTNQDSRKAIRYRSHKCLNCGTPLDLTDVYCSYCGQLNTTKRLSLKDFFGEFVRSIFTYDSRFRFTVKDLLFKPGTITENYVQGKRIKYANPFRFFLSVSIVYFLLSSLANFFVPNEEKIGFGKNLKAFNTDKIQAAQKIKDSLGLLSLDNLKIEDNTYFDYIAEEQLDTLDFANTFYRKFTLFMEFYEATEIDDVNTALDQLNYKKNRINSWIYERNATFKRIEENPLPFFDLMLKKIPFFLFFFAPVFALTFLLIYFKRIPYKEIKLRIEQSKSKILQKLINLPVIGKTIKSLLVFCIQIIKVRRPINYMEHLIFIFHVFTFIFLGLLLAILPDMLIGNDYIAGIFFVLIGPFYFYKALRNFYKENRFKTIFKFLVLNYAFLVLATFGGLCFILFNAATY